MTETTQEWTRDELKAALQARIENGDQFAIALWSDAMSAEWKHDAARASLKRYAESVRDAATKTLAYLDDERSYLDTLGSYALDYEANVHSLQATEERLDAAYAIIARYLDPREEV